MSRAITIIWAVLIALKLASLGAVVNVSWWIIIFWPVALGLVAILGIAVLALLGVAISQ